MGPSVIYELYYEDNEEEISIYAGKSSDSLERLKQHILCSLSMGHTDLYSFINSNVGWKRVRVRLLHDNLPEDSDEPVVCYYERLYYDELSKKYDMKNSCPPLLSTTPVSEEDIKMYKDYSVHKSDRVNSVLNAYLQSIVKNFELQNANELLNKNKLLVKEKSKLNEVNGMLKKSVNSLEEDKKRNLEEIDKLKEKIQKNEAKNDELMVQNNRCIERIHMLTDKLIEGAPRTLAKESQASEIVLEDDDIDFGEVSSVSSGSSGDKKDVKEEVPTGENAHGNQTKQCKHCDKFISYSNYTRHLKICKVRRKQDEESEKANMGHQVNNLKNLLKIKTHENMVLKTKVDLLTNGGL